MLLRINEAENSKPSGRIERYQTRLYGNQGQCLLGDKRSGGTHWQGSMLDVVQQMREASHQSSAHRLIKRSSVSRRNGWPNGTHGKEHVICSEEDRLTR